MKRIFYVCASILMLAVAYHLVVITTVQAQPSSTNSQATFERVVTRQLVIQDGNGNVRAALGVIEGRAFLALNDMTNEPRVTLSYELDGTAFLAMKDANGRLRGTLMLKPDGTPVLKWKD